jgi:predicted small metal-binding protein
MLALRCPCGLEISGKDEDDLVEAVNAHLEEKHPRVAGAYDRDDILTLAYRRAS